MIQPSYTYKAMVVNVVDGDTLDADIDVGFHMVSRQRLRLARVDAAETNSRDSAERIKAQAAKAFVIVTVMGRQVIVQTTKTDSFGRYLAELWYEDITDQHNLSDELIASGVSLYTR